MKLKRKFIAWLTAAAVLAGMMPGLSAPVFAAGAQERSVYLPKGDAWREVATGKTYEGGQTVTAKAPIDVIPLFVRVGADLPL